MHDDDKTESEQRSADNIKNLVKELSSIAHSDSAHPDAVKAIKAVVSAVAQAVQREERFFRLISVEPEQLDYNDSLQLQYMGWCFFFAARQGWIKPG